MSIVGIVFLFIGAAFIGILIGIGAIVLFSKLYAMKVLKEGKKFLEGKRDNLYELDGKRIRVDTFILPGEKEGDEDYEVSRDSGMKRKKE